MLYALHDSNDALKLRGVFEVSSSMAVELNKEGYGIFMPVNEFKGKRQRVNLSRIVSWYCETDDAPKDVIERLIADALIPSRIIESKRGYHIYWDCIDASEVNYESIQERLIAYFHADKGVKDLTRILRAPGFYHMKDPKDPFLVRVVFESKYKYYEHSMRYFFKLNKTETEKIEQRQIVREALKDHGGQATWSYFIDLNCKDALARLSGSNFVGHEVYEFLKNPNGTHQIYVNKKRSQCWIDHENKIGSHSKGGPGIFNWIKWFGYSNREVVGILKQYFPEGFNNEQRI